MTTSTLNHLSLRTGDSAMGLYCSWLFFFILIILMAVYEKLSH